MRKNILERLERIDRLIRIKGTGTPAELAARLKCLKEIFISTSTS